MLTIWVLGVLTACDSEETLADKQGVQEYTDTEDIPTPSDDLDDTTNDGGGSGGGNNSGGNGGSNDTSEAPTGPVTYNFSDTDSLIYVQVFKDEDAWGSDLAHDHVIRATGWTGSVTLDTSNPADCQLDFTVPVELLSVDEDGMRSMVGYDSTISSSDRAAIRDHMLGDDQLNVDRHDDIRFLGDRCSISGDQLITQGSLTVAGGTGSFSIRLQMTFSGDALYLQGSIEAEHADFGLSPFSAYGGFVRNSEPLPFTVDLVGLP